MCDGFQIQSSVIEMNCTGKTAIVAGGFGGIGYATCNSLLGKGLQNLGIFDLTQNTELLRSLTQAYPKANVKFWPVDARNRSAIENGFKGAIEQFKSIDILVTSVGVVDEMNPQRTIEINLLATMYLNFAALEFMSNTKGGKGGLVANIASLAGIMPFPECPLYCATKFGLVGFTRSLGTDLYFNTSGIKFVAICPGFTTTPILDDFKGSLIHDVKEMPIENAQTPEICGSLLVDAIEKAENGTVWMIANGSLTEVVKKGQ